MVELILVDLLLFMIFNLLFLKITLDLKGKPLKFFTALIKFFSGILIF